jgi:formylglycine-generating enzyme required for sulfatase activity
MLALPLIIQADDERGFIKIKDKAGKDVCLYENSYALIIGVSKYTNGWPDLPGVKKDIPRVKEALEKQGFKVFVIENPTYDQMEQEFKSFINKFGRKPDDRLLFYFSGHGHTIKLVDGREMGYIVPADAENPNIDQNGFFDKAMDMQQIEVYAKRIQSKHALFMFDSCFSGSIFDISRAIPDNISYKTAKPVRQIITAGAADETVPDNSIFCRQFIEGLKGDADTDKDGYVTGVELGEFLQKTVINYSKKAQNPQYGKIKDPDLDKGDFVFQMPKTEPPQPQILPTKSPVAKKDDMVLIPAGEFQMGDNGISDAKVHTVYLDAFCIDKYEVTNAQYKKFVQATGHKKPEGMGYVNGKWQNGFKPWSDPNFNGDDQPVVCVSWEDAKAYADWAGKRLPTEAEWEKAARGGVKEKKYVWGDDWPPPRSAGNFADISAPRLLSDFVIIDYAYTAPVGSFKSNGRYGYGLYDMAGNVWEWCEDWYDSNYYATSPKSNPAGPSSGSYHVCRGGSWDTSFTSNLRVAFRYNYDHKYSCCLHVGFRCVR